jgi:HlyD family secretion protein
MKRIVIILLIVIIVGAVAFLAYRNFLAPVSATPTPMVQVAVVPPAAEVVSAEGFMVPARRADLSFKVPGQIVELAVKEGDTVQAGQVLARLDNTDALSAVDQAEDSVKQAEAGVAQANAAVEVARAAVVSAQAQLAQVKAGPTAEQIAQAEAAVRTARARLNQTTAAARSEDLDAQASVLLKAEAALRLAQTEYDKVSWADNKGETPQALALQQATLDYEAAKAQYDRLKNGATEEEIAIARAGVAEAEAALAVVKAGPTQEAVVIAEAAVTQAEANVKQAEAGVPTAEAALSTARTNLETARKKLDDYSVIAPFSGTMSRVQVNQGEFVPAGTPVMSLGNNSTWHVDTDDLSEIDVVQVVIGQEAEVKVDALPGQTFKGVVSKITPRSETKRGDVTYTVTIELMDAQSAPLRWGMTAFVDIVVGK